MQRLKKLIHILAGISADNQKIHSAWFQGLKPEVRQEQIQQAMFKAIFGVPTISHRWPGQGAEVVMKSSTMQRLLLVFITTRCQSHLERLTEKRLSVTGWRTSSTCNTFIPNCEWTTEYAQGNTEHNDEV